MGRTRKTYRLSDEVIQLIENRDRTAYPTATDYIEAKLNKPTKDVTELLYQVSMQLEEIKRYVIQLLLKEQQGLESRLCPAIQKQN